MNGRLKLLRKSLDILFRSCSISCLLVCLSPVDLFNNLTDAGAELFVCLYFLCGIDEQDVSSSMSQQCMLLFAPAFTDSTLEKIALYSPFEHLFGYRHHYPVGIRAGVRYIQKSEPGNIPVLTFGNKLTCCALAAESFLLGESFWNL